MDESGALAQRLLFIPFEISFAGREDSDLEGKSIAELPGVANWALEGLRRLRRVGGRFTLGNKHREMSGQYGADTASVLTWVRETMVVSAKLNPGDLPSECVTEQVVKITKSDAYELFREWCGERGVDDKTAVRFGRNLRTALPKLEVRKAVSARVHLRESPRILGGLDLPTRLAGV